MCVTYHSSARGGSYDDVGGPAFDMHIRICAECHSPVSLHSIQADTSKTPGTIEVGGELAGFGHVGRDGSPATAIAGVATDSRLTVVHRSPVRWFRRFTLRVCRLSQQGKATGVLLDGFRFHEYRLRSVLHFERCADVGRRCFDDPDTGCHHESGQDGSDDPCHDTARQLPSACGEGRNGKQPDLDHGSSKGDHQCGHHEWDVDHDRMVPVLVDSPPARGRKSPRSRLAGRTGQLVTH